MAGKRRKTGEASRIAKSTQRNPSAAVRERERLRVFNESLESLQKVIPIRLPVGRKLHKKQTLQLACRYITFLRECLDGKRDWEERRRFWCSNDDDHNIIDAIDAASRNTQAPEPAPKKPCKHRVSQNDPASLSPPPGKKRASPPPNVQVAPPGGFLEKPFIVKTFVPGSGASAVSEAVHFSNALLAAHAEGDRRGNLSSLFPVEYYASSSAAKRTEGRGLDEVWSDLNEIISEID